jgi:hypothetical protein
VELWAPGLLEQGNPGLFSCQSGFFNLKLKLNPTCGFEKHANPNSLNKIMLQVFTIKDHSSHARENA